MLNGCDLKNKESVDEEIPALKTSISKIAYKSTLPGFERLVKLKVSNKSFKDKKIVKLFNPDIPFTIVTPTSFPVTVPSFGEVEITVSFKPSNNVNFTNSFVIKTDDPLAELLPVTTEGSGSWGTRLVFSNLLLDGTIGAPVRINDKKVAVVSAGADGVTGTADDSLLVFEEEKQTPTVVQGITHIISKVVARGDNAVFVVAIAPPNINTRIATIDSNTLNVALIDVPQILPALSTPRFFGSILLIPTAGVDNTFGTADDQISFVNTDNQLASSVTTPFLTTSTISLPVPFGGGYWILTPINGLILYNIQALDIRSALPSDSTITSKPEPVSIDPALSHVFTWRYNQIVVAERGPDNTMGTSDDRILRFNHDFQSDPAQFILSATVSRLVSRAYQISIRKLGKSLWAGSFSRGPVNISPGDDSTGQEKFQLIKIAGDGTTPIEVIEFSAAGFANESISTPEAADNSDKSVSIVFSAAGADNKINTADDIVKALRIVPQSTDDFLFSTSNTTDFAIANLASTLSIPTKLREDVFVVTTLGNDGLNGTGDESIYYFDPIKGFIGRDPTTINLRQSPACRPIKLTNNKYVLVSPGPDGVFGTGDEQVIFITIPEE